MRWLAIALIVIVFLILAAPDLAGSAAGHAAAYVVGAILLIVNAMIVMFPLLLVTGIAYATWRFWRRRRTGKPPVSGG